MSITTTTAADVERISMASMSFCLALLLCPFTIKISTILFCCFFNIRNGLNNAGEVDPDTAIVAADPLCQQALECQAEDMAIEDTLYALERALTDGHLPFDTYLKQVSRCNPCCFLQMFMQQVLRDWCVCLCEAEER